MVNTAKYLGLLTPSIFAHVKWQLISQVHHSLLAARAGKRELSCLLGISRLVPQDQRSFFFLGGGCFLLFLVFYPM